MIYKYYLQKQIDCLVLQKSTGKAVPLFAYLNPNERENIERHTKFLSMVSNMDIQKIEEIEEEQKVLNQKIPFKVKYPKDFLWQIYYSEYTNQYFMLVPTEELDHSAFFYLLKKQLEGNNQERIFVPISHSEYSRDYLNRTQISDIENYLWLFTKEWPIVYEVYDKNNNLSLHIAGKTYIFDDIKSDYKIELKNKEDAIKFYKLLKALFIMQTEIPYHYEFKVKINEFGSIDFYINNKKVIYEILPSLIKEEYLKAEEKKIRIMEEKIGLEKELDALQKESSALEKEYLEREKQIATFLVCKKTFFGRVRYFFKYKKITLAKQDEENLKKQEIKVIRLNKYGEVKSNYTLEELIEIYKNVDKDELKVKNLGLDIKAITARITNLQSKVKNAMLYIKEIDNHKKSIFDFWRFTNKDKQEELPEGKTEEKNVQTLKKVFDYELDFEDFGIDLDKNQRELLTKQELDSIYLATTGILEDINKIARKEEITSNRMQELKEEALQKNNLLDKDSFDIFGGMSYDNKLKNLATQKHRESEKDLFNILDIHKNTTQEEYTETIKRIIDNLKTAFEKIKINMNLPVYKCEEKSNIEDKYNVYNITATGAINKLLKNEINEVSLFKININENTKVLGFTNSAYYENTNKTLPLGMDVEQALLLDNSELKLKEVKNNEIKIVCYEEGNELSKINVKSINVKEFDVL